MKIFRSVKTNQLNQGFDASPSMVEFYKNCGMSNHGGYDWACYTGEPIYWNCDIKGRVLNTEIDSAGGLGVNIITEDEDGIFKHRYWHLKTFLVEAGDKLRHGDIIGLADNTGKSTGTHLHTDTKEMVRDLNGNYCIKNHDNGTFGTIRNDQYFTNIFILDQMGISERSAKLRLVLLTLIKRLTKK
jgi:hypothetical protein